MATQKHTLKATIGAANPKFEASQPSTPMVGAGSLVAEGIEVITVRTYFSERGNGMQPVRACVWIRNRPGTNDPWVSGRGSASGCGYHKESAAIADALTNAGVQLFGNPYNYRGETVDLKKRFHFGGTGSSAYADIFKAVARARGFKGPMVWVSHGL